MRADLLHVVTVVANPIRWQSRIRLARAFAAHMLASGVKLTIVECAYGERPYELDDIPGLQHVPVRSKTMVWNKENLVNIGIPGSPRTGNTSLGSTPTSSSGAMAGRATPFMRCSSTTSCSRGATRLRPRPS